MRPSGETFSPDCVLKTDDVRGEDGCVRVPAADLARMKSCRLDFILQFTEGFVQDELLQLTHHGLWRFCFGENDMDCAYPPAFRELSCKQNTLQVALQRRTVENKNWSVLEDGYLPTVNYSLRQTLDAVYYGIAPWPAKHCRLLRAGKHRIAPSVSILSSRLQQKPTAAQTLRLSGTLGRLWIRRQYRALARNELWGVGIAYAPIESFLASRDGVVIEWLPELRVGRFLADPFAIPWQGGLGLLAEQFDYRTRSGHIVALTLKGRGPASEPRQALRSTVHMAYPYLFSYNDDIYCVPDTGRASEVQLYRATAFPYAWEQAGVMIRGFGALDPTIFWHEDRWWLLCTDRKYGPSSALYGWYAASPLGPWTPHLANPLKTDIRSSRPAGTPFISAAGQLYRPAQDCSDGYGRRIIINRVLRLTPTEFAEEPAGLVEPVAEGPYPDGVHTICGAGDYTVFDGKRETFIWPAAGQRLKYLFVHHIRWLSTRA